MLQRLEEDLEDFDFSAFQRLSKTREKTKEENKVFLIPIKKPIPYNNRILRNIVAEETLALKTPESQAEFSENVKKAIKLLLNDRGNAVCFFCPRNLLDYRDFPSSKFVKFDVIDIEDRNKVLKKLFEDISGRTITSSEIDEFSEFVLRATLSYILDAKIPAEDISNFKVSENQDIYLTFADSRNSCSELASYYYDYLGIEDLKAFKTLSAASQKNVFGSRFIETYEFIDESLNGTQIEKIRKLDLETKKALRASVFEYLRRGLKSDLSLEDLLPQADLSRAKMKNIEKAFKDLTRSDKEFSSKNPGKSGKELTDLVAPLFLEAEYQEIETQISTSRHYFLDEISRLDQYNKEAKEEFSDSLYQFLEKMIEIGLTRSIVRFEKILSEDGWKEVYLKTIKNVETERYNKFRFIPDFDQAFRSYKRENTRAEKADKIEDIEPSYSSLENLLEYWSEFLIKNLENEEYSDILSSSLIGKYEEFCDWIIQNYDDIEEDPKYEHISGIIGNKSEKIKIFLVIDSFGYLDYKLMEDIGCLSKRPDNEEIVFSNIPSYTPSAMTTVLTGLKPRESGVYEWTVKKDGDLLDLGRNPELEFVEAEGDKSFQLIQNQSLSDTGITNFAKRFCPDIRLANVSFDKNDLDSVGSEFLSELDSLLELRRKVKDGQKPPEAENAIRDTYVFYLESFDEFLHSRVSLLEFKNYYLALSNFIEDMIDGISTKSDKYDFDIDLVVTADHGKITKHELNLIGNHKTYSFNNNLLLDSGIKLQEVYGINLDYLEEVDREGKVLLKVDNGETPETLVSIAKEKLDLEDCIDEQEIEKSIYKNKLLLSSSKFLFGYQNKSQNFDSEDLEGIPGIDVYEPEGESIFDSPDIGLLSRYLPKNQDKKHHGYHGGTSVSEMCAAKLTYEDV